MPYPKIDPLDWSTIQPEIDCLLGADLTAAGVDAWLQQWSDLEAVLDESANGIERAVTENTADKEAEARFLRLVEEIQPKAQVARQALRDRLLAVKDYKPSAETALLWRRLKAEAGLFRPQNVPIETELHKLSHRYDEIAAAMSVDWNGKAETMPQAMLHLREKDRAVRERAWRLMMARWQQDRAELDELYLKMLKLRRQEAANAGKVTYRDYVWQDRKRFDYTPEDCFTFHDAIEHEFVPAARRLNEQLAGKLGLAALRPWDTEVDPNGEPLHPFADVAELEEGVHRIFRHVDAELAGYFGLMRQGWLDLPSRPNKAPGGYCSSFPVSRRPYIFMNAVGTHDDVSTLLHEGGHSVHFMESSRHPLIWNHWSQMEFAEVGSMGMELLAAPYLARSGGGFYTEADARRAHREQLEKIVRFLPYMAVVDAFQHWVYTAAPEAVTAAELDAKWSELWDRFMQGVDWSGLEAEKESGWHRKLHIFQIPFYYVEYGLAQLGALQVWRNALTDQQAAVARYRSALALGYTRSLPELYSAAGARFAFDRETVGSLAALVTSQMQELA